MISPQLCKTIKAPLIDKDYIMEQKFDGIRAQLTVNSDRYRIESRGGQEITHRFPEIQPLHKRESYVLDGEIVHFNVAGLTDFQAIQARVQREADIEYYASLYPAVFVAFDCLMYESSLITNELSLLGHKDLLPFFETPNIQIAPYWLNGIVDKNTHSTWEGFIYKRKDSLYQPGKRSSSWLKYKFVKRETVWAVGFTHGIGRRSGYFGALIVARLADGAYRYAGTVGTGYTDLDLDNITGSFNFEFEDYMLDLSCKTFSPQRPLPGRLRRALP